MGTTVDQHLQRYREGQMEMMGIDCIDKEEFDRLWRVLKVPNPVEEKLRDGFDFV